MEKDKKGQNEKDAAPSTSGSAKKRRKSVEVEPRTPLKRQRVPVQRFQSPTEELLPVVKAKTPKNEVELVYKKGVFLAVRGDSGSFYLCRTQQNVFQNTKHFKIQWLDKDEKTQVYKFDFLDHTEIECVLTNVRMERVARETYQLPDSEKARIELILSKALKKEKGEPYEDLVIDTEEEISNEEGKNGKKQQSSRGRSRKKEPKEVKKEKKTSPGKKRGPDRNLLPNPKIKILEKDPLFETKDHVPFISRRAHQRLIFRAVYQNDMDLLKQLLDDDQHIQDIDRHRSIVDCRSPLHVALEKNNVEAVKLIFKDRTQNQSKRLQTPSSPVLLSAIDTGRYNQTSLGVRAVLKLNTARGNKEGNKAFLKDTNECDTDVIQHCLLAGVKKETLDAYLKEAKDEYLRTSVHENIHYAVSRGHLELSAKLMDDAFKNGGYGFNFLHRDVLNFTTEDLKPFQSASVRKKPLDNAMMTPMHCACINPNVKYLEKLLAVEPDYTIEDKYGRRPVHFAAACQGTGPLELLLKKGATPNDVTRRKVTPLHFACYAGRAENADILIEKAKSMNTDDQLTSKWGEGGVDRPTWETICPIHIAVQNGDMKLLNVLLKHGANVNKALSAGKDKLTPLMLAAAHGHLDIARRLIQMGATVEQLDKFKRSALTHAVMNGNANVASYLLYLGADPNRVDSSGNSLVHYAAAYGWYFVLKLLVNEGGAKPSVANDWQLTPVGVAFLKDHMGLVDFLLKMPGVDVNFKIDTGQTLISIACSSQIVKGLVEQMSFILDKGADPTIVDVDGFNALHHLSNNTVLKDDSRMDITISIAKLLIKAGCSPKAKTKTGQTPIMLALTKVNTKLVKFLIEEGGAITPEKNDKGQNSLHLLTTHCTSYELASLLRTFHKEASKNDVKENGIEESMDVDGVKNAQTAKIPSLKKQASFQSAVSVLQQMANDYDDQGFTPLLLACEMYMQFRRGGSLFNKQESCGDQYCLDYIKTLIEITRVNCNQCVKEKEKGRCGLYTPVHFMVQAAAAWDNEGKGLKFFVTQKPNLESAESEGKTPLALAVTKNSLEIAKMLIEAGAKTDVGYFVNKEKGTKVSLVNTIALNGTDEMLKLILAALNDISTCRNTETMRTPLHEVALRTGSSGALLSQKINIAEALLKAGAAVNATDKWNRTPMHYCVSSNLGTADASTAMEELLIDNKADLFLKCSLNRIPLHYLFDKVDRFGKSSTLDPIELCTVLTSAMKGEHVDDADKNGQSALHLAAQRGATICCIHLLQQRNVEINRKDINGNTPLSLAVSKGHDSCAIMLIQKGASVNEKVIHEALKFEDTETKPPEPHNWVWKHAKQVEVVEKKEFSVFQDCIKKEQQGVAYMVLEAGDINASMVEAALRVNKFNVAMRVLKRIKDNSKVHMLNEKKQNLFHILALCDITPNEVESQYQMAEALKARGVSLSQADENGCVPLHYAALKHQPYNLAKFYIENDKTFEPNKKDKFDRTVLAAYFWGFDFTKALSSESEKWLKLLSDRGASLDFLCDFPMPDYPSFDVISKDTPNYLTTASSYRISPLIQAISGFHFELSKYLLKHGASANFADSQGITPMMHAVKKNDVNLVKLLLNNSYCHDGETSNSPQVGKVPFSLSKQHSRHVFQIRPIDDDVSSEKEESEEEENEPFESEKEESDQEQNENEDEVENSDHSDEDEDSDRDTDILEEEEEEEEEEVPERFPSIIKITSKEKSISKEKSQTVSENEKWWEANKEKTITKTSDVNVNATDQQGWTAVHHTVCPLEVGTFDNVEILTVLAKCGAEIQKKDHAGLSPLDHALIRGACKLAAVLQELSGVEKDKMEKPTFASNSELNDNLLKADKVDYHADAEALLKKYAAEDMEVDGKLEKKVLPDSCCALKNVGEVVYDESQGIAYDALLSKVDVSHGAWGMYNFYRLQIVYQKGIDLYILFTRWGRIGDSGQYQHTPFHSKAEAVTEFCKVFRSKTGNTWASVKNFENHPKKYRLVQREQKQTKARKVEFCLKSDIPSKLPKPLQDLMKELSSVSMLNAATKKIGLDDLIMPFGQIKKETLLEGKKILLQIGEALKRIAEKERLGSSSQEEEEKERIEIGRLSNEYYHLVPMNGYAFDKVSPIMDGDELKEKLEVIHHLLELECASKILMGAQARLKDINPLDYVYQAIGCGISLIEEESAEAQYILKYIYSSCHKTQIQAIYKICRPGEEEKIRNLNIENHKLLWHGSNTANFISILHRGLLVAPTGIPITGHLFGEGIYSADAFAKSVNYCYNISKDSNVKFAVLCEVALGKSQTKKQDTSFFDSELKDTDFKSRFVDGSKQPDEDFTVAMPGGYSIPLGMVSEKKNERPSFYFRPEYNEYIVEDHRQVCLKYLVQFTQASPR
ncbi:poly [ADP-ribose] polymerase tankyrase-like isoform X2 [Saccostrea echinata]|uniref:poly [ADP-ribose] polymerase tankyrase-like isoform X2 n=1 Tax=Saccostrea echinata TaxID=191078 RepID=UPI002A80A320|nr:poly [ADP-ribose] polymerase tankyrase-like isoform X2 [Saccostrea echinata]